MLASVPLCEWRLRHNNRKVFRVPMEVSSTGEIHLRGFTAGEMQNPPHAPGRAPWWGSCRELVSVLSSVSCWPSAALSGHSGELQAAAELCSLPAFDKWTQKYSIHFWVFFNSQRCPSFWLNLFLFIFYIYIYIYFLDIPNCFGGRKLTPALPLICPAILVAADLLMDNKLANSSGFSLNNLIQRPCVLCLFS